MPSSAIFFSAASDGVKQMHDGPAQVANWFFAVDALVGPHNDVDRLVANRMALRLQAGLGDQFEARDVFVLATWWQQQNAAIVRVGLLARHDAIGPRHAPAFDTAIERKFDANKAQHVGVLLSLKGRNAFFDIGLA